MKKIRLSNRLAAAAAYIEPCAGVIDVGTDHGYLPVYLAQTGLAQRIVAADINDGPLKHAMKTAMLHGITEQIEFIRTDGLVGISPKGIDTVVIAGMGGETMIDILEKADWVRAEGVRLILQPQSKLPELTCWLRDNSFYLRDACLSEDDGRIYEVLYTAFGTKGIFTEPLEILMDKRDELLPSYLDRELTKTQRMLEGMSKSAAGTTALTAVTRYRNQLSNMKEETLKWQR